MILINQNTADIAVISLRHEKSFGLLSKFHKNNLKLHLFFSKNIKMVKKKHQLQHFKTKVHNHWETSVKCLCQQNLNLWDVMEMMHNWTTYRWFIAFRMCVSLISNTAAADFWFMILLVSNKGHYQRQHRVDANLTTALLKYNKLNKLELNWHQR